MLKVRILLVMFSWTDSFVSVSLTFMPIMWIPVLSFKSLVLSLLTPLPLLQFNRNNKSVEEISLQKNISKIWPEPLPAQALLA